MLHILTRLLTPKHQKKEFIDLRLNEVKNDLENYENQLLEFSEKNKDIDFSPRLMLQKDRIQKNISLHKQLYFTLADQLELAKINEKDNTSSFFLMSLVYILPRPGYR